MNQIKLTGAGKDWNATYRVEDGKVWVSSAYGADGAPVTSDQDPEPIALQMFEKIVKRWAPSTRRETFKPGSPFVSRRR